MNAKLWAMKSKREHAEVWVHAEQTQWWESRMFQGL